MNPVLQTTNTSSQAPCDHLADRDEPPLSSKRTKLEFSLVLDRDVTCRVDLPWLREKLRAAIGRAEQISGRSFKRIETVIIDDARMTELHNRHLGQNSTTDVLTFDLSAAEGSGPIEADIAICADVAARRAAELGHSIERELLLYAIHGLLHCAGFDDHNDEGFAMMHAEEDRILAAIGVPATFSARKSNKKARRP